MIVLFTLILVVLMGMAALVVDVGVLRRANQELWSAMDAGALAGASQLPANGTNAQALAVQYAQKNYNGLATSSINVTFRCLVGDRDNNGISDAGDVPSVCNPGNNVTGQWVCSAKMLRRAMCPERRRCLQHGRRRLRGDRPVQIRWRGRCRTGIDATRRLGRLYRAVRRRASGTDRSCVDRRSHREHGCD